MERYAPESDAMDYSDDAELTEEERYIMEKRRSFARSQGNAEDDRPRQRRRDDFGEDDRPRQRRRDDFGEDDRPRQRRRDDFGEDDRPRHRRRDDFGENDRQRPRRRPPERELTDQEKYLMEERRKRQSRMNPDGANQQRGNRRPRS